MSVIILTTTSTPGIAETPLSNLHALTTFSAVPIGKVLFSSTFSIFDHTYLEAMFNPSQQHKQMTMKDFMLGSDEYLIHSHDHFTSLPSPFYSAHIPQYCKSQPSWCGREYCFWKVGPSWPLPHSCISRGFTWQTLARLFQEPHTISRANRDRNIHKL